MAIDIINFKITAIAEFEPVYAELAKLRASMAKLNATPLNPAVSGQGMKSLAQAEKTMLSTVKATRAFTVETVALSNATEHLTQKLVRGKFTLGEYMGMWKQTFGRNKQIISELNQIAEAQAKVSTAMVSPAAKQGYAHLITSMNGAVDASRQAAIYQRALNTALNQGATSLINFGKNTQWAGRQLTAGLSMPVALAAAGISKLFYDVDKELTRLAKVYGVGAKTATDETIKAIRGQIVGLGQELARSLGISSKEVASMAADLAAAGLTGKQLIDATRQASRMVVLGEADKQEAIKATIALQTAYKLNTKELTDAVNFFNAAQAATSTNMADLIEAVPKVGPVVRGLGGTYKDMVALLTAMKEGGVPAAEAANAIKNSLGRLINPTQAASDMLMKFGINIKGIVSENAGNLIGMITTLQTQLDKLPSLQRQQAIAELFGKFQFARMAALMDNFNKVGTQSAKVIDMMGMSSAQLANVADAQTKKIQQSVSGRFKIAVESIKADLVPVGQVFLSFFTKILSFFDGIVKVLNKLGPFKNILLGIVGGLAIIGPITMIVGLFANMAGQILKAINYMRMFKQGFQSGGGLRSPLDAFRSGIANMTNFFKEIDKSLLATQTLSKEVQNQSINQAESIQILTAAVRDYEAAVASIMSLHAGGPIIPPPTMGGAVAPVPRGPGGAPMLPQIPMPIVRESKPSVTTYGGLGPTESAVFLHSIPVAKQIPSLQTTLGGKTVTSILHSGWYAPTSHAEWNKQIGERVQPTLMPSMIASGNSEKIAQQMVSEMGYRSMGPQGTFTELVDPRLQQRNVLSSMLALQMAKTKGIDSLKFTREEYESHRAAGTLQSAAVGKLSASLGSEYEKIIAQFNAKITAWAEQAEAQVRAMPTFGTMNAAQQGQAFTEKFTILTNQHIMKELETADENVKKAFTSGQTKRSYESTSLKAIVTRIFESLNLIDQEVASHLEETAGAVAPGAGTIAGRTMVGGKAGYQQMVRGYMNSGMSRAEAHVAAQEFIRGGAAPIPAVSEEEKTARLVREEERVKSAAASRARMRRIGGGVGMAGGMVAMMASGSMKEGSAKTSMQAAGMGSMIGGMFGPEGAAIGLAVGAIGGAIVGAIKEAAERAKEKAAAFKGAVSLSTTAIEHFGIKVRDFGDVAFKTATAVTRASQSEIDALAAKYKAQQQNDTDFQEEVKGIKNMGTAEQFKIMKEKFLTDISAGMTSREAQVDVAAYMKNAGISGIGAAGLLRNLSATGYGLTGAQAFKQGLTGAQSLGTTGDFLFTTITTAKNLTTLKEDFKALGNNIVMTSSTFDNYNAAVRKQNGELAAANSTILTSEMRNRGFSNGSKQYQDAVERLIEANHLFATGAIQDANQLSIAAQSDKGIALFGAYGSFMDAANNAAQGLIGTLSARESRQTQVSAEEQKRRYQIAQANKKVGYTKEEKESQINQEQRVLNTLQSQLETNQKMYDLKQKQKENAAAISNIEQDIYSARAKGDLVAVALGQQKLREEKARQREIAIQERNRASLETRIQSSQNTLTGLQKGLTEWSNAFSEAGNNYVGTIDNSTTAAQNNADMITHAFDNIAVQFSSFKGSASEFIKSIAKDPDLATLKDKLNIPTKDIVNALTNFKKSDGIKGVIDQFDGLNSSIKTTKDLLGLVTSNAIGASLSNIAQQPLGKMTDKVVAQNKQQVIQALASAVSSGQTFTEKDLNVALNQAFGRDASLAAKAFGIDIPRGQATISFIAEKLGQGLFGKNGSLSKQHFWSDGKPLPAEWLAAALQGHLRVARTDKNKVYYKTDMEKNIGVNVPIFVSESIAKQYLGTEITGLPNSQYYNLELIQSRGLGGKHPNWQRKFQDGKSDKTHYVSAYATGGYVSGPGTSTSDSIPARLSDGEYVVKADSVNKYGTSFLDSINAGHFADGGHVKKKPKHWWQKAWGWYDKTARSFWNATMPTTIDKNKNISWKNPADAALSLASFVPVGKIGALGAEGVSAAERGFQTGISKGFIVKGLDDIERYFKPTKKVAIGEFITSRIYQALGVPAAKMDLISVGSHGLGTASKIIPGIEDLSRIKKSSIAAGMTTSHFDNLLRIKMYEHLAHDTVLGLTDIKLANLLGKNMLSGPVSRLDMGLGRVPSALTNNPVLSLPLGNKPYSSLEDALNGIKWSQKAGMPIFMKWKAIEALKKTMPILGKKVSSLGGFDSIVGAAIEDASASLSKQGIHSLEYSNMLKRGPYLSKLLTNSYNEIAHLLGMDGFAGGGHVKKKPKHWWQKAWNWLNYSNVNGPRKYRHTALGNYPKLGIKKGQNVKLKSLQGIVPFAPGGGGAWEEEFAQIAARLSREAEAGRIGQLFEDVFARSGPSEKIQSLNQKWAKLYSNPNARALSKDLEQTWNRLIHYYSEAKEWDGKKYFSPMGNSNDNWWFGDHYDYPVPRPWAGFAKGGMITENTKIRGRFGLHKIADNYLRTLNAIKNKIVLGNQYALFGSSYKFMSPEKMIKMFPDVKIGWDRLVTPSHNNGTMWMTDMPQAWKTTGQSYDKPPFNIYQVMSHEFGHYLNQMILTKLFKGKKGKNDLRLSDVTHEKVIQWAGNVNPLIGGINSESLDYEPSGQKGFTTIFEEIRADLWSGVMGRLLNQPHSIDFKNIANSLKYINSDGTTGMSIWDPTYVPLSKLNSILSQKSLSNTFGMEGDLQLTDAHGAEEQRRLAYDIGYAHPEQVFKLLGLEIPKAIKSIKSLRNANLVPDIPGIPKNTKYIPVTSLFGDDMIYTDELPNYVLNKVKAFRKFHYGFANGGHISGKGTSTSDSIPAFLSNGEYVVKADSVSKYGVDFMNAINAGHFAEGGMVKGIGADAFENGVNSKTMFPPILSQKWWLKLANNLYNKYPSETWWGRIIKPVLPFFDIKWWQGVKPIDLSKTFFFTGKINSAKVDLGTAYSFEGDIDTQNVDMSNVVTFDNEVPKENVDMSQVISLDYSDVKKQDIKISQLVTFSGNAPIRDVVLDDTVIFSGYVPIRDVDLEQTIYFANDVPVKTLQLKDLVEVSGSVGKLAINLKNVLNVTGSATVTAENVFNVSGKVTKKTSDLFTVSKIAASWKDFFSMDSSGNLGVTIGGVDSYNRSLKVSLPNNAWTTKEGGKASGGYISGPGTKTSDSIPAMLSNGEYVIKADSVSKYGIDTMHQINAGKFAAGGPVFSKLLSSPSTYSSGGLVEGSALTDNSVYNINVSVAGSNATPDEIANKVLQTIRRNQESVGTMRRIG